MPDGYNLMGKTLILLETFVRVNPDDFERKWKADMSKLISLKEDLCKIGITLVPVVDGRSSYNTQYLPEWATERFRWLLIEILRGVKMASEAEVEDQEYQRLIHSLAKTNNQSLGFENLEFLKRKFLSYDELLETSLLIGVKSDTRESKVVEELIKTKIWFKHEVYDKGLGKFVKTDKPALLSTLVEMGSYKDSDSVDCIYCSCKLMELCHKLSRRLPPKEDNVTRFEQPAVIRYNTLLSLCNKIKGSKIFNTRRNTLLFLDLIMLNFITDEVDDNSSTAQDLRKAGFIIGQMVMLVNDRALDILAALKLIRQKLCHNVKWLSACSKILKRHDEDIWCQIKSFIRVPSYESLFCLAEILVSERPIMRYTVHKDGDGRCRHSDPTNLSKTESNLILRALSHISLSLINSMKTSFSSRLLINERDYSRYFGNVRLKECYVQKFSVAEDTMGFLFYQKTGERSRCYTLYLSEYGELVELGSFYCDPKRFFVPIFSEDTLDSMCDEMVSWLDFDKNLMAQVDPKLRSLTTLLLCSPSKRNQTFMQGLRYFIMAYVNQAHHVDLMSKLEVECKSSSEIQVQRLAVGLCQMVLSKGDCEDYGFARRFKFLLNVSYLCHLITKETPDRLTDQIKCFEKFLEPKLKFGSVIVNPSLDGTLTEPQEQAMIHSLNKFFKKSLTDISDVKEPGISKELLSFCVSLFNRGKLRVSGDLKTDPFRPSYTSTALDLSSNKSVVVPKLDELGNVISKYDKEMMISTCVTSLVEMFKTKGRYNLDPDSIDFLVLKNLTNLVSANVSKDRSEGELSLLYESLTEEQAESFEEIKQEVHVALSKIKSSNCGAVKSKEAMRLKDDQSKSKLLETMWSPFQVMRAIKNEVSIHEIRDFDPEILEQEVVKKLCSEVFNSRYKLQFFLEDPLKSVPLEMLLKNLTTIAYIDEDYMECFKYLLIQGGFDQKLGTYEHKSRSRLGLSSEALKAQEGARVSTRESNAEAIAKKLDKTFFTSAALRNLCFYSEDSPTEFTSISTNTGNLKFGLSYKEQVGSNRELYVGDLNTKLMTRLVEDFSEVVTSSLRFSCLNSEKEFERAICDMKMAVNNGDISLSMDHSKWGPYMSPALFFTFLANLNLTEPKGRSRLNLTPLLNVLKWHLHKTVEVPFNVAQAYCVGKLKRSLGLMECQTSSLTEEFYHSFLQTKNEIPSHIMSVLDMGQGILHNLSDLYALITEQFLNYILQKLYDIDLISYTSSDDQISILKTPTSSESDTEKFDWLEVVCFHEYLSSKLNKFISPKSVVGNYVAEFKSRFFVMGEETPLLTKFVAAALHNVKCKTPTQLAETVDTICDQCVANGVGVSIVSKISTRVNRLIKYSGFKETPFLTVVKQDVKCWTDGSRGYRLQWNIENCMGDSEVLSLVRRSARRVFVGIKNGRIFEENLIGLIGRGGDQALQGFLLYAGVSEEEIDRALSFRWLNPSTFGDLRLVLRTKIMSSRRVLEKENVPSLIKTLQSRMSRNFTKGVKKILAESINKSAFQSSIASGFIGFCKSMGSKCVRDGNGGFIYLRDLYKSVVKCHCEVCINWKDVVYCNNSVKHISRFTRSIMWDYFTLVLTNACELGEWVFSDVKLPATANILSNPNLFWAVKPRTRKLIEDRLGLNQILQSIRKNYPKLFEEYLLPFMNDLQTNQMMNPTKIKFLDICVALDMVNENLGIIGHLLRGKNNLLYIVKQNECAAAHIRQSDFVDHELGLSSQQVCFNFKVQILFSSMIDPLIMSTSVLKSFFWYNEVLHISEDDQIELDELTDFTLSVRSYGIERAMTLDDMTMGYVCSNMLDEVITVNSIGGGRDSLNKQRRQHDLSQFLKNFSEGVMKITLDIQVTHERRSTKFCISKSVTYSFRTSCSIPLGEGLDKEMCVTVDALNLYAHGTGVSHHLLLDGVSIIPTLPLFNKKKSINLAQILVDSEIIDQMTTIFLEAIFLDFSKFEHEIGDKFSYDLVGPEDQGNPIVLKNGVFMVDNQKLSILKVDFFGDTVMKALGALETMREVENFLCNLWPYLRLTKKVINFNQIDFETIYDMHRTALLKSLAQLDQWLEFTNFSVAFSKHLQDLVVSDNQGDLRLKGVTCRSFKRDHRIKDIEKTVSAPGTPHGGPLGAPRGSVGCTRFLALVVQMVLSEH
ncbi:RNA polymerase [Apore virus]|uniref:RNA-directed RNA polymerase L n=1 Tax=Apore virus TaxID=2850049 RepID=A0A2U7PZY1_9VIRU|nr:RNA polymerase [Apore virus]AUD40061.1 RNA polymerase [Apore virus]